MVDCALQVEMDEDMTVRCLNLSQQGFLQSYFPLITSKVKQSDSESRGMIYSESLISSLIAAQQHNPDLSSRAVDHSTQSTDFDVSAASSSASSQFAEKAVEDTRNVATIEFVDQAQDGGLTLSTVPTAGANPVLSHVSTPFSYSIQGAACVSIPTELFSNSTAGADRAAAAGGDGDKEQNTVDSFETSKPTGYSHSPSAIIGNVRFIF